MLCLVDKSQRPKFCYSRHFQYYFILLPGSGTSALRVTWGGTKALNPRGLNFHAQGSLKPTFRTHNSWTDNLERIIWKEYQWPQLHLETQSIKKTQLNDRTPRERRVKITVKFVAFTEVSASTSHPNSTDEIQMQKLPILESCKNIEGAATAGRMR